MAFMKFSKGKKIYSVPNGLGDGSAYFDGASSYANLSDSNLPMGNSARSISLWFNKTSKQNEYTNLVRYGTEYSNYSYSVGINDSGCIETYGCNNTLTYNNEPITLGKWYHVVITFNTDYTEQCYLNGVLVGTQTHNGINTHAEVLCLGNWYGVEYFQGNLKDLKIYNLALTADEVTTLYNHGTVADGLVLNVPLQYGKEDESIFSPKNFVYDYSAPTTSSGFDEFGCPISYDIASECGINYTTIPTDGLILYMALKENITSPEIVDSDVFTTSYEGNYNSANYQVVDNVPCLYLDSNSNITLTRGNKEIRQATFAYCGKFEDSSQCIITNSYDTSACVSGGAEFWLAFGATGAYFTSGNHTGNIITANMSISADWHHIAVTWDMDTNYMYLYLDGELIGECTDQSWLAPNINRSGFVLSVNNLYRATSIIYGNGHYSSVRMYDRVLTANEIKALAREI